MSLYRSEALESRRQRLEGDVLLTRSMSLWVVIFRTLFPLVAFLSLPAMGRQTPSPIAPTGRTPAPDSATIPTATDLVKQVEAVCINTHNPCPRVVLNDRAAQPIETIDGGVSVATSFAASARSPVERIALAALVIAWSDSHGQNRPTRNSDLGKQLAAIGVLGVGEALDPLRDRADQIRRSNRFNYEGSPDPKATETTLAANALVVADAAGSCSGAFVDVMRRTSALGRDPSPEHRRQAAFAARLLATLGSGMYPPDYSCLARGRQDHVTSG